MQVYEIIFSPTGGTKKVADILCDELGNYRLTVDLSNNGFNGCEIKPDSIAIIAIPSFGGRAPKTAVDRLKMVKANGEKAVVVAVYGNREQEDTLIEIADVAKECGFKVVAGISAIAEHSIAHQYATGRPDNSDKQQLIGFVKQISEKPDTAASPEIPGNRPYKKAGAGMVPKATSACISCAVCAMKCPVGAINKENPKKVNKSLCINCMRCVSVCPKNARKGSALMTKMVGVALKKACSERKENKLYL